MCICLSGSILKGYCLSSVNQDLSLHHGLARKQKENFILKRLEWLINLANSDCWSLQLASAELYRYADCVLPHFLQSSPSMVILHHSMGGTEVVSVTKTPQGGKLEWCMSSQAITVGTLHREMARTPNNRLNEHWGNSRPKLDTVLTGNGSKS